jgi:predicted  nucleic acid-binding Zn-ribbon protein
MIFSILVEIGVIVVILTAVIIFAVIKISKRKSGNEKALMSGSTVFCTQCGSDLTGKQGDSCPKCGTKVSEKSKSKKTVLIILLLLAVMLLTVALIWALSRNNALVRDQAALEEMVAQMEAIAAQDAAIEAEQSAGNQQSDMTERAEQDTGLITTEVGDIIEFGPYEWRVLEVRDGRALIITERVVERRRYLDVPPISAFTITWAETDLRQWLNSEFLDRFTSAERDRIIETQISNPDNPWFGIPGGTDTTDHVFLLSIQEVVRYFGDSGQLENRPPVHPNISQPDPLSWEIIDEYNHSRLAYYDGGSPNHSFPWNLRSPGSNVQSFAYVQGAPDDSWLAGNIAVGGTNAVGGYGVRPALWLDLGGISTSMASSVSSVKKYGRSPVSTKPRDMNDKSRTVASVQMIRV